MSESYYTAVYWPGRHETIAECARRAETFFRLVTQCHPMFARWFEQAETLEEALQLQFEPDHETLERLFAKRDKIDHTGFVFGAWTGQTGSGHGSMLLLSCGFASESGHNSCLLYLPYAGSETARVLTPTVLSAVLGAMVLAWEPSIGLATSDDLPAVLREDKDRRPSLGWLTYFASHRGPVPPLAPPVRVEPLEDKGTLVILTSERLSAGNPEHVALALGVQAVLDEQNLLAPVIPPRPPRS